MRLLRLLSMAAVLSLVASGCVWRTLASVDLSGNPSTGSVLLRGVSDDGRYVLMLTSAALDPLNDTNGVSDLYRHDTLTGQTRLVTVVDGTNTAPLGGGLAGGAISGDGQFVVFASTGAHDPSTPPVVGTTAVYVRDMNTTTLDEIVAPGAGYALALDIDAAGTAVSFLMSAEVQHHHIASGTTTLSGQFGLHRITADGSAVILESSSALVAADTNGVTDVYRWNVGAGTFSLVSQNAFGTVGTLASQLEDSSDDGRRILFRTESANMVLGDTNGVDDLYVKDVVTGSVSRVTVDESGNEFVDGPIALGGGSSIDGSGGTVVFRMPATTGPDPLYRHRVAAGETLEITPEDSVNGPSDPEISGDGNYVAYVQATQVYVQFLESPVVDSVAPATVPVGATTSVTIEGSGFLNDANVYLTGRAGVSVSNAVLVDFETITADVTVDPTATPGPLWVNVETVGTGPGASTGAFGNCGTCLAVS